jgi:hypothetical protein
MPVKNIIPCQKINPEKLQRSRELRKEMTPAEKTLWQRLRGDKLGGFHFRRQQTCPEPVEGSLPVSSWISIVMRRTWSFMTVVRAATRGPLSRLRWDSGREIVPPCP